MKRYLFILSFFLFFSCADKKVSKEDLHHLNGYWEIQKVEFPNGQVKEYKANTMVDYIQFENGKGMRKKVQPRLDGTFITSEDEEPFELILVNQEYSIHYKNTLSEWQEKLKVLDSLSFVTQNEEGIRYFYTRFQPISIQL
ncbi:lipocalin family protein [Flagellimonas sp.]|uniref:lipocalin family protein n=1 Tax=Flagellimonas sp. TaxID=2058762 RepID=UPI003F4A4864